MAAGTSSGPAIAPEVAGRLCAEIRAGNHGKWYTPNGVWCLMCEKVSRGEPAKICYSNQPGNRGCGQVNRRSDSSPSA